MKKLLTNLNFQVIAGIVLGILTGIYFPSFAPIANIISKKFILLITLLIPFIIFFTIVLGIAGMRDLKKIGRVGGKALLYFEIVSTLALIVGIIVANAVRPGDGFVSSIAADHNTLAGYQKAAADMRWSDFIEKIIPANIID